MANDIEPAKLQGLFQREQPADPTVERVFVVTKNHFDYGFTGSAGKIWHDEVNWKIGVAMQQARAFRERGGVERFCWTVQSFLLWEALDRGRHDRADLERAVLAGDLSWVATPFTMHVEAGDRELIEFGLSLSQRLDARFGRRTTFAKITDVPGVTRGLVPLLDSAGVRLLHVGVNHMSSMPAVPPAFRWRHPDGAEVVVLYWPNYGGEHRLAGSNDVLLFNLVGDNMEVPSQADIEDFYRRTLARFPNAAIHYGDANTFADAITPGQRAALPVVTAEIGDTWIHGVGTDPAKVARLRALLRLRKEWLRERRLLPESRTWVDFHLPLLSVVEHTWGCAMSAHLRDTTNYANEAFHAVRHRGNYGIAEASWQEQRDFLELAEEALPGDLRDEAIAAGARLLAAPSPRGATIDDTFETTHFRVALDRADGSLRSLVRRRDGAELVKAGGRLARLEYQTHSVDELMRFVNAYTKGGYAVVDFAKPGLEPADTEAGRHAPRLEAREEIAEPGGRVVVARLRFDERLVARFGAARTAEIAYRFPDDRATVEITLQWFDKTATRLPEAFWFSFEPRVTDPAGWRMEKLGDWVSPLEVVSRGARSLHAIGDGGLRHEAEGLVIRSWDAPLVAPGTPELMDFNDQLPDLATGFHFNLWNNKWGTNFPAWYDEDARFRFVIEAP